MVSKDGFTLTPLPVNRPMTPLIDKGREGRGPDRSVGAQNLRQTVLHVEIAVSVKYLCANGQRSLRPLLNYFTYNVAAKYSLFETAWICTKPCSPSHLVLP